MSPPETCERCRREFQKKQLPDGSLRYTSEEEPIIVLASRIGSKKVRYLQMKVSKPIVECNSTEVVLHDSASKSKLQDDNKTFHAFALEYGKLVHPEKKPKHSHCNKCSEKLPSPKGEITCVQCGSYVCLCGSCLCGEKFLVQSTQQFVNLEHLEKPMSLDDRSDFLKVVIYCAKLDPPPQPRPVLRFK